jgi:AhpD family alkylhydroperoxidase
LLPLDLFGEAAEPGLPARVSPASLAEELDMEARIDPTKTAPEVYRAMLALESAVRSSGLERNLLDLVRLRASQINGCAYCIDMHSKDLRNEGEIVAAADGNDSLRAGRAFCRGNPGTN